MPPEANLKDKPRVGGLEQETAPAGLVEAGTGRLDQAALTRMRTANAADTPSLTLETGLSSCPSNNADRSVRSSRTESADQPLPGTAARTKIKAFAQAPTFLNSMKYLAPYHNGAIEIEQRWQNNTLTADPNRPDGTMTGSTRYVADNKTVRLYWRQEQNGQKTPDYAVESSKNAAGDVTHNYFDYTVDAQDQARIDYSKDRGQIVIRADDKGATRGGFVRAPKSTDGNCELTVFDSNTYIISKQPVTETVAHDPTALAAIEQQLARVPAKPVERVVAANPIKPNGSAEPTNSAQLRTKGLVADSDISTTKPKSTETLSDGSTRETIDNGDGTLTQRHLLGSRMVITDLDKSKQMRQTTTLDSSGRPLTRITYSPDNKEGSLITLSHQDAADPNKMVSRSWISKGNDSKGQKTWTEMPASEPVPTAQRTCYNLNFNMDDGSWRFNDANGDRYIGTWNSNDAVQDKSAEALDLKERAQLRTRLGDTAGDAAYETQKLDLQKKLEAKGISFSDKSGVKMTMADGSTRTIPTDAPSLQQLRAVEQAMGRFLPSDKSELKDKVKFTFLKEDMDDCNGRYTDNGNIYIYPQASRIQSCMQADTGVGHRTQIDRPGNSLEATIDHEYTHLIEETILANNATRRAYVNGYGVDYFEDPLNDNKETWAVQGKHEYDVNGQKKHSLYKAVGATTDKKSYACSVTLGSDGKPLLDIKSTGESSYIFYERRNPDGSKYIGENGKPERLWNQDLMKVARLTPSSHYLTGAHAATEARTQLVLGGLSRDHLFQDSALYERAKKDDQDYIGADYIRSWDGNRIVRRIDPATKKPNPVAEKIKQEIEAKEKKLKPFVRSA